MISLIIIISGTFAIISLMVGESVESHFQNYPVTLSNPNATLFEEQEFITSQKVKYTVTLTFMVGIFQVYLTFLVLDENLCRFFLNNF